MKNSTVAIVVLAALLMVISPVFSPAQDKKNVSDDKDTMLRQMIELSKTGQNHLLLSGITGSWSFTGRHFPSDPDKKPLEFKGTAVRKGIMDGRYSIFETTGGALKMPWSEGKKVLYRDMYIEGYDNHKKKLVTAMVNNHWSTAITTSEGQYEPNTSTITYRSKIEQANGMKITVQSFVKKLNNDHYWS